MVLGDPVTLWLHATDADGLVWTGGGLAVGDGIQLRSVSGATQHLTVTAFSITGTPPTGYATIQCVLDSSTGAIPKNARVEVALVREPAAGAEGPPGPAGPAGADSTVPGPTGPAGATGPPGATGPAGPQGEIGPMGPEGPEGPQGEPGEDGAGGGGGSTEIAYAQRTSQFVGSGYTDQELLRVPSASYDGTRVCLEFFCSSWEHYASGGNADHIYLKDALSPTYKLALLTWVGGNTPRQAAMCVRWFFTPPAGNHEYLVGIEVSTGNTMVMYAGNPSPGGPDNLPMFLRIASA